MATNVPLPLAESFRLSPGKRGALWSLLSSLRQGFNQLWHRHGEQTFIGEPWELLRAQADEVRLRTCARLLRNHARRGDVLEIGCGDGHLVRHLTPTDYATWLGVDVSDEAIDRARKIGNERVRFIATTPQALELSCKYDAIVFSQPIYYLPDPVALLRRYARHLKPEGVFIISLFENGTQGAVWREIQSVAYTIGSCVIEDPRGIWTCEALRMQRTDWHTVVDDGLL